MDNNIWQEFIPGDYNTQNQNDIMGVVYVAEYGNYLKIGATSNINRRYKELSHQANDYFDLKIGRVFFTISHNRFFKNEKRLHNLLLKYRKENTELFNISLDDFFSYIDDFDFDFGKKNKGCDILSFGKYVLSNGFYNKNNKKTSGQEIDKLFRDVYCPYCTDEEFSEIMSIVSSLSEVNTSNNYFLYLLTKMQNIIFRSNERYLKSII